MSLLNLLPQEWKDKAGNIIAAPFNNHPKATMVTLTAVGVIAAVALIVSFSALGITPSLEYIEIAALPMVVAGTGLAFGLVYFFNNQAKKAAAEAEKARKAGNKQEEQIARLAAQKARRTARIVYAIIRVACPILVGIGSVFLLGYAMSPVLAGTASTSVMNVVVSILMGIAGAGGISGSMYLAGGAADFIGKFIECERKIKAANEAEARHIAALEEAAVEE